MQRQWIGLQSIFGSTKAVEQMPDEAEAFEQVDSFWRTYLRRIRSEQSNILVIVEEEGLFELLAEKNKTLAAVQRKLEVGGGGMTKKLNRLFRYFYAFSI